MRRTPRSSWPRTGARKVATALLLASLCTGLASAAPSSPLLVACAADQHDRDAHDRDPAKNDWTAIGQRDRQRQDLVIAALRAGRVRTFEDHRCAALILLHAGEEDRLRLSLAVATQGELLFDDRLVLPKLAARAWDRLLMARGQPQWYATQFETGQDGQFQLAPLAADVLSDPERVARGGLDAAGVAAQLHQLNARVAPQPPKPAAAPPEPVRFRMTPALLKAALARDEALGNALVQFVRQGVPLSAPGDVRQGQLLFIARPAEALQAFIDDPSSSFPRAPGSATPTRANGVVYRLEAALEGGRRLVMGLDDSVQAAATVVVTPTRWFEVTVSGDDQELTALAWRPLPAP